MRQRTPPAREALSPWPWRPRDRLALHQARNSDRRVRSAVATSAAAAATWANDPAMFKSRPISRRRGRGEMWESRLPSPAPPTLGGAARSAVPSADAHRDAPPPRGAGADGPDDRCRRKAHSVDAPGARRPSGHRRSAEARHRRRKRHPRRGLSARRVRLAAARGWRGTAIAPKLLQMFEEPKCGRSLPKVGRTLRQHKNHLRADRPMVRAHTLDWQIELSIDSSALRDRGREGLGMMEGQEPQLPRA